MIQSLKRWCSCASKHKKLLLSIIVSLCLMATAIWDATMIIIDYVDDNIVTVTKINSIKDSFPFFRNDPMKICINYPKSIFKELWNNENASRIADDYWYKNLDLIAEVFKNGTTNTTSVVNIGDGFDSRIAAVVLTNRLYWNDYRNMYH